MKNEQKNAPVMDEAKAKKLLEEYRAQTANDEDILRAQTANDEDIHFEHYDWTYNDSSCCC